MPKLAEIAWDSVEDSSNVDSVYRHEGGTICVRFKGGGIYGYMGAPETVYLDLRHAESVGRYLNRVVKQYPYTRFQTEDELIDYLNT